MGLQQQYVPSTQPTRQRKGVENKRRSHHSPDEGLDRHEELLDAGVPHHLRDHTAGGASPPRHRIRERRARIGTIQSGGFQSRP